MVWDVIRKLRPEERPLNKGRPITTIKQLYDAYYGPGGGKPESELRRARAAREEQQTRPLDKFGIWDPLPKKVRKKL